MDMTFREDDHRVRRGDGVENFWTLRHFALILFK
jgi:predicted transposase YbfD/YdcC